MARELMTTYARSSMGSPRVNVALSSGGIMRVSRRRFMQWAPWAMSLTTIGARTLVGRGEVYGFRAALLPSQRDVWAQQVWMAELGPKYTGNRAHTEFVDFLAKEMAALGLQVQRDRFTFPRWEAGR